MKINIGDENVIFLFDIDGTLTKPRQKISPETKHVILSLKEKPNVTIGFVGGSDLSKQKYQLGEDLLEVFDYGFSENGLVAYHHGELIHSQHILNYLNEDKIQFLINRILFELSKLKLPFKRGSFIEFRTGMLNICPCGADITSKQREEYVEYEKKHQIRKRLIANIKKDLDDLQLVVSTGGQISMDIYPLGWDKTYCLQHLDDRNFDKIFFLGL